MGLPHMEFRLAIALVLLCSARLHAQTKAATAEASLADFFETKVRPVFAEHCYSCHGPKKHQAGLRLDNKTAALLGSDDGPVLVPGHPEKSSLIKAIAHTTDPKMPPKGKLPDQAIEDLTTWVKLGAVWPEKSNGVAKTSADEGLEKALGISTDSQANGSIGKNQSLGAVTGRCVHPRKVGIQGTRRQSTG